MIKTRVDRAISLALKIPRSVNPLAAPYKTKTEDTPEPLQVGIRWWKEDGEIKKGRAARTPYRHLVRSRESVLNVNMCFCDKCQKRFKEYPLDLNAEIARKLQHHQHVSLRHR